VLGIGQIPRDGSPASGWVLSPVGSRGFANGFGLVTCRCSGGGAGLRQTRTAGTAASFTPKEVRMELEQMPEMLRVDEAAAVLRISRSCAYDEIATFERTAGAEGLPAIRIGRCLRVPKRALLAWIDAQLGDFDAA
jgi:excisionase family DNA binding protein